MWRSYPQMIGTEVVFIGQFSASERPVMFFESSEALYYCRCSTGTAAQRIKVCHSHQTIG